MSPCDTETYWNKTPFALTGKCECRGFKILISSHACNGAKMLAKIVAHSAALYTAVYGEVVVSADGIATLDSVNEGVAIWCW